MFSNFGHKRFPVGKTLILALTVPALLGGCGAIRDRRGYVADEALMQSIQPGVDNQRSVEGTLGRPTFTSQFGEPTWYYVSSAAEREILSGSQIVDHRVVRVKFDANGNVADVETSGLELVRNIRPDGEVTPTLGRDRSFFEDLFGNIGSVGAGGMGAPAGGPPGT